MWKNGEIILSLLERGHNFVNFEINKSKNDCSFRRRNIVLILAARADIFTNSEKQQFLN